ncbi:MAG: LPXTG cell wall anchor domain-containing protein [Dehalococcoidales bacterium]|nr:LPXTG cell wall anchor domain-containing protein [Dehalococcoidales bacterium]
MPYSDSSVLLIMGGIFAGVGLGLFFGDRRREKQEDDVLASRLDVKEFLKHSAGGSIFRGMRLGGLITAIVGLVMLGIGGGIMVWG